MNFIKIKETCLYIHDLEQARKYYHEMLEFPVINYLPGKHLFLRVGTSVLLCFNPEDSKHKTTPPPHCAEGKQHVAFEVSQRDYQETKIDLVSKGIKIIDNVTWESGKSPFTLKIPREMYWR